MGWLFGSNQSNSHRNVGPRIKQQKPRLQVEQLEERMVLDSPLTIPAGTLIDNITTFAALQTVRIAMRPTACDIIPIDSGSLDNNHVNENLFPVVHSTTQDDSGALSGGSKLPSFAAPTSATLERADSATSPMDAGSWIGALSIATMAQAAVANDILHSSGALGGVVEDVAAIPERGVHP